MHLNHHDTLSTVANVFERSLLFICRAAFMMIAFALIICFFIHIIIPSLTRAFGPYLAKIFGV